MSKTLRTRVQRAYIAVLTGMRKERGLNQRELAGLLGKSHSFISKIESGERRLDLGEFIAIAKALKVNPIVLFTRIVRW